MKMKRLTAYILLYNFIGLTVAIGGWFWEVLLFFIKEQHFVNRGFLYGPYLPVYGTGAIFLSMLFYRKDIAAMVTYARSPANHFPKDFYHSRFYSRLKLLIRQTLQQRACVFPAQTKKEPAASFSSTRFFYKTIPSASSQKEQTQHTKKLHLAENIRIFFISMAGGSLTEFVTGWFLWHVFHKKYWDYSGYPLNIGGYVCIFSALGFGIFGTLWMAWISPRLVRTWEKIRFSIQILIIGLSDIFLITDTIFSFMKPNSGENITFSLFCRGISENSRQLCNLLYAIILNNKI